MYLFIIKIYLKFNNKLFHILFIKYFIILTCSSHVSEREGPGVASAWSCSSYSLACRNAASCYNLNSNSAARSALFCATTFFMRCSPFVSSSLILSVNLLTYFSMWRSCLSANAISRPLQSSPFSGTSRVPSCSLNDSYLN